MTASVTFSPRYASASRLSFCRMNALICWAVKDLSSIWIFQSVPMCRLTERMVRSTLVTACRLATSPTSTSALRANATTDGVVRAPSALVMTVGSPPSRTETTELVVPRSMPTGRAIVASLGLARRCFCLGRAQQARGVTAATRLSPVDSTIRVEATGLNFVALLPYSGLEGAGHERYAGSVSQVQIRGRVQNGEVGPGPDGEVADIRAAECASAPERGREQRFGR